MYPCRQNFLVLGLSKSGQAAAEFLLKQKATVYIYDDLTNERVEQTAKQLEEKGARRVNSEQLFSMCEVCDVLVLSPGVPIDHPLAITFRRNKKAVVGETELAARFLSNPMIAITGTNGKTTTVSMLTDVLNRGGISAKACGNIGEPMLNLYQENKDTVAVAEISSFQLETLNSLRPHIAIVLNITEDHLNRHYNMENYLFLKAKLLKNSTESEFVILNYDDEQVRSFANNTKANTLFFSVRERVRGAYYENGDLYFGKEKIMSANDLHIGGLHNVQNALTVIAAAKIMGVKSEVIAAALGDFQGIKHRVERVGEIQGVTYIDDSKGTNVDATIKAISAMKQETILLLGGKNKGYDYNKLFAALGKSKVVYAVLYGENRFALLKSAREFGFEKLTICENFEFAVRIAALRAKAGQTVLLSPASASFDEFASYEERGDKFVEIIQSFARENVVDEYENTQSDTVDEEEIAQEIITKNASNPSANFAQEQSSTPIAPITAIEDFKLDRAERFIDEDAE